MTDGANSVVPSSVPNLLSGALILVRPLSWGMTRSRWQRPLPEAVDAPAATVTRVVGDHELGSERARRYEVRLAGVTVDAAAVRSPDADAEVDETGAGDGSRLFVTVPDGAGLARVRLPVPGTDEWVALRLPGPTFGEQCTAARRGDLGAAKAVRDAFESPVALALACGEFLDAESLVDLLAALAAGSDGERDALHAARYDVLRSLARSPAAAAVDAGEAFETVADGFDAIEEIGDVEAVDALGDVVAVCHDSPAETRAFLDGLGYDLAALERRDDGRFFAAYLAQVARSEGVGEAMAHVNRRASGDVDYGEAKRRAEDADYWERGVAWRALLRPAARRERGEFAYVLANACYWSGEVARTDSRLDELLHEGAEAAAASIGLEWVEGRARFQRLRSAGHRNRSSRNHALALDAFERAEAVAADYDFLDPWEPVYSQVVVRSNWRSSQGDNEAAVAAIEDGLDRLREFDVPAERREEMVHHLDGQKHERLAILARFEDDAARREHLEAAAEHYRSIGFERSADRLAEKLEEARRAADEDGDEFETVDDGSPVHGGGSGGGRGGWGGPVPVSRPARESGVAPDEVPDLHDYLTEPAADAVGSPDPGVLPDEHGGPHDPDAPGAHHDPASDDGWY